MPYTLRVPHTPIQSHLPVLKSPGCPHLFGQRYRGFSSITVPTLLLSLCIHLHESSGHRISCQSLRDLQQGLHATRQFFAAPPLIAFNIRRSLCLTLQLL